MAKKIVIQVETKGAKDASKNIDNVTKSTGKLGAAGTKTSESVGGLGSNLGGISGPAKAASGGLAAVGKQMWALVANPIGLVIAALALAFLALKKAFASTEEGQNKMSRAMNVLSTIVSKLFDALEPLATFIFDTVIVVFKQLGEAAEEAAALVSEALAFFGFEDAAKKLEKFVEETGKAATAAGQISKMRAEAEKIERKLIVERAETEAAIADARAKAIDIENVSAEDRKAALVEAARLTDALAASEQERAQLLFKAIKLENSLTNSNIVAKRKEAELEADFINIQTKRSQRTQAVGREIIKVDREVVASNKKRNDDIAKANEEAAKKEQDRRNLIQEAEKLIRDITTQNLIEGNEKELTILENKLNDEIELAKKKFGEGSKIILLLESEKATAIQDLKDSQKQKELDAEKAQGERIIALKQEQKAALAEAGIEDPNATPEELKKAFEARAEVEQEIFDAEAELIQERFEEGLTNEEEKNLLLSELDRKHKENITKNSADAADAEKKIDDVKAANKLLAAAQIAQITSQLGSVIQQAAGENKEAAIAGILIDKIGSIGSIIVNTAIANAKAVATSPTTLGQPFVTLNTIAAGIGIAGSIAGAAKAIQGIKAVKTPGAKGGGGGGSGGGGGGGLPSPSSPSVSPDITPDIFPTGFGDDDDDTLGGGPGIRQEPIRAIVVESDITNTQNRIQDFEQTAELG